MTFFLRGLLKSVYRLIQAGPIKNCILPFFFSKARRRESFQKNGVAAAMAAGQYPIPSQQGSTGRIWFHAASVGELECLWPVIISAAQGQNEIILSILSESARSSLESLKKALSEMSASVLYGGYSPWEGEWAGALHRLNPTLFITAKYEAWPDLWVSLREKSIPLAMVSVHARKSLKIARFFCEIFSGGVPRLLLFPCLESEVAGLRQLFPQAEIDVAGEPRWDRVYHRAQIGNPRAQELIRVFQKSKRPWGVVGSAWGEDLNFLTPTLRQLSGTLWVVPHRVDPESIQKIEEFLIKLGIKVAKTSLFPAGSKGRYDFQSLLPSLSNVSSTSSPKFAPTSAPPVTPVSSVTPASSATSTTSASSLDCVLVDEMGFLSELYSVADWAFVGGGFGVGIHSTIEPAIHGIPIGVGPNGTPKFSEVTELTATGQLTVLRTEVELQKWWESLPVQSNSEKARWKSDARFRLGATQKILAAIEKFK